MRGLMSREKCVAKIIKKHFFYVINGIFHSEDCTWSYIPLELWKDSIIINYMAASRRKTNKIVLDIARQMCFLKACISCFL